MKAERLNMNSQPMEQDRGNAKLNTKHRSVELVAVKGGWALPGGGIVRTYQAAKDALGAIYKLHQRAENGVKAPEKNWHYVDPNKWAAQQPMNIVARMKSKAA